jgi:hypothetical protein
MMFVDGSTWNDVFRMASQAELPACGSRPASWYPVMAEYGAVSTEMRHGAAGLLVYFLVVCPGLGQLGEFAA